MSLRKLTPNEPGYVPPPCRHAEHDPLMHIVSLVFGEGVLKIGGARSPDVVFMNPRNYEALKRALEEKLPDIIRADFPHATPLQVATTTSVALAGLGFLLARRSQLQGSEDDVSFCKMVADWLVELIRGLLAAPTSRERKPHG